MKNLLFTIIILVSYNSFAKMSIATFAGGCFWCMEPPFEKLIGVSKVISGYSGGDRVNPSYEDVSSGTTKHRESIQVFYDDRLVSYKTLLETFWKNINPTDSEGQFVDRGFQYTSAIFFHNEEQKILAEQSLNILTQSGKFKKIVTPILPFKSFYAAEEYHQDFYKKNLVTKAKYKYYRNASGRDDFINKYWREDERIYSDSKFLRPSEAKIKKVLSTLQYNVTQKDDTERPFQNLYWDNKAEGIYVDIVSGEPLFSSRDKFKSGTGWPSFTRPINPFYIVEKNDSKLFQERIEVRSRFGNSHLGHVFSDGPKPTGLRYCINSASLKFIPKKDFAKYGLDESML